MFSSDLVTRSRNKEETAECGAGVTSPGNGLLLLPDNAHGKSPINFGDTAPGSKRAGTKVDDSVRKERRNRRIQLWRTLDIKMDYLPTLFILSSSLPMGSQHIQLA